MRAYALKGAWFLTNCNYGGNDIMKKFYLLLCLLLLAVFSMPVPADENQSAPLKTAVVLAVFGTSHASGLPGIMNIHKKVQAAFPDKRVELAFTSTIIREIWQKRRSEPGFAAKHPEIPKEIINIKGPLAAIACLQDEGYDNIIVQPTHIAASEEFTDLSSYVNALGSIRTIKTKNMPFKKIVIGRPALGNSGVEHEYSQDIRKAARAMSQDVVKAAKNGSALVYMGHGNEHFSTGVYIEFGDAMREMYPSTKTYIGVVEGFPSVNHVMKELERDGVKKVYLKPFMTVAGDHAKNDMAGEEPDSWKKIMESKGIKVSAELAGVGENPAFADIFVQHVRDAAKDNGIIL